MLFALLLSRDHPKRVPYPESGEATFSVFLGAHACRYRDEESPAEEIAMLKGYIQNTIRRFKDDKRVLMWELYNEPGVWLHDLYRIDGTPFDQTEIDLFKKLTGVE